MPPPISSMSLRSIADTFCHWRERAAHIWALSLMMSDACVALLRIRRTSQSRFRESGRTWKLFRSRMSWHN
jgi:hypothetical protein